MKLLNEQFRRMQKLAGINEIKINNPNKPYDSYSSRGYEDENDPIDPVEVAFMQSPGYHSYKDVLDMTEGFESVLDKDDYDKMIEDFKNEFSGQTYISKHDYLDYGEKHIDDVTELQYVKANWVSITDPSIFTRM
jgi:hypothetical protein